MMAALNHSNFLIIKSIYRSVFLSNPTGPIAAEFKSQRFGLTDTRCRILTGFNAEFYNPFKNFRILICPPIEGLQERYQSM